MGDARPLNLATLGTGGIATRAFAPALRSADGVRLWSVLSRDLARGERLAAAEGAAAAPAFDELDRLLDDPLLDGVIITTPDRLRAERAIRVAQAGKHVLTEKPMATSTECARAIVAAARDAGVRFGVAYHLRW